MSNNSWLVQYQSGSYRFGRVGADRALGASSASDPTDLEPLVATMADAGYSGQNAMLAIPSQWCLSAAVVLASRRMTRNRQAVAYAVEERLPLSAEDMVCDYVSNEAEAFGVAVDTSMLLPVVRSLEEAGVAVTTITPTAILLLERLAHVRCLPTDGLVVLPGQDSCDLFAFTASQPRQWRCLPLDAKVLTREIAALLLAQGDDSVLPVTVMNLTDELAESLREFEPEISVTNRELDVDQALLAAAEDVLTRGKRPWIELRRDRIGEYDPYGLMRGSIRFLLVALLITLASLTVAAWTRANKYQTLADSVENQKRAVFRQLFPEARVPVGIRSRLESERRKLLGMSADAGETPEPESVTGFLVDALDALPTELRFRLLEMRFEERTACLEGEVRRHGDADVIASSLRSCGFDVEPPRTEQLASEGVGFTLNISIPRPSDDQK